MLTRSRVEAESGIYHFSYYSKYYNGWLASSYLCGGERNKEREENERLAPAGEETLRLQLLTEQRANNAARHNHTRIPARSR